MAQMTTFAPLLDETFSSEHVEMMGQGGTRQPELGLDLPHHETLRVGPQEQSHDLHTPFVSKGPEVGSGGE